MKKIQPGDPETRTLDVIADNVERLKALFPDAFSEGKIDFEVLKQLLGGQIDEREEKYGLNWHGKRQARQLALSPSTGTLRPCPEESVDWEKTQNLFIEGDNLEVLKLLQKSYAGKVKLIYMDPPYNRGKDRIYRDNYSSSVRGYLESTGQAEDGERFTANTESSGRLHTNWLNLIYPRLLTARSLLRQDGVLFVSLDECESHHFIALANEVFGKECFVANIAVVTNLKGRNDKKHIAMCHEQLIVYGMPHFVSNGLPLTEKQRSEYRYHDESNRRYALRDLRKRGGPDRREDRPLMFFAIYVSADRARLSLDRMKNDDIEILPIRGDGSEGRWRWGKEKIARELNRLHVSESNRSGRFGIQHRVYLDIDEADDDEEFDPDDLEEQEWSERTTKPKSIWLAPEFSTDRGKRSLKKLLPGEVFSYPKSVDLLRQCISLGSAGSEIVIDLFAGSGTFFQAAVEQNQSDCESRQIIVVQFPEILDAGVKEQRAAAEFCASLGKPLRISEITKERMRRSGKQVRDEGPLLSSDAGFRVFKLDSSNFRAWDPGEDLEKSLYDAIDHIQPGRSEQDLLFELLLKQGLELTVPIETRTLAGKQIHAIGGGVLIACLAESIGQQDAETLAEGVAAWRAELAPDGATVVFFRDSAFTDDVTKTNVSKLLEQRGIETVRSL